jgi:CelD/BcsL family acetyltransferase involved in cellulose biosynthesis
MNSLQIRTTDLRNQPATPDWWDALLESAGNPSIFLTPAWVNTWLDVYGEAFTGSWVSFWSADRCVGGFMLLRRKSRAGPFPVRLCALNTAAEDAEESPWVEYNDVLCVPGFEPVVAAATATVLSGIGWDQLYLSGYAQDGVLSRISAHAASWHVDTEWKPARYVDLAGLDSKGIDSMLSSNTRSQVRRSAKIYSARGELRISAASSIGEAQQYLRELARLHREGWRRRGKEGGFRTEQFVHFHDRLIERLWSTSSISILCASAGDLRFAYLYNFVHRGRVYFYQSGLAYEDDPKVKPGLVAHYLAMNHFLALGMIEYDFMAGDARYKQSLANGVRQLAWTRVERNNFYVRLVRAARDLRNRCADLLGRNTGGGAVETAE